MSNCLIVYRGKLIPFSNGKKDGSTVIHQAATGLTVTSFSSQWQKQDVHNAPRSFTLTEALFSNPVSLKHQFKFLLVFNVFRAERLKGLHYLLEVLVLLVFFLSISCSGYCNVPPPLDKCRRHCLKG